MPPAWGRQGVEAGDGNREPEGLDSHAKLQVRPWVGAGGWELR